MSNRNELRRARRKAQLAAWEAEWIESLPRRRGERVRWRNGVVWTRAGDDDWRPESDPDRRYSSSHVASMLWEPVG